MRVRGARIGGKARKPSSPFDRVGAGAVVLSVVLGLASTAYADNISGTYRNEGFVKAARGNGAYTLNVSSQECWQAQLDAFSAVLASTQGSGGTFGARWPGGIKMQRTPNSSACTGTLTTATDIRVFYYETDAAWHGAPFGGHSRALDGHENHEAGGEEHAVLAPQSYCSAMGLPSSTCGLHPSVVHINGRKWDPTSSAGQGRLIMHETGHSQGLDHHCTSLSVMNNGDPACNGGAWLPLNGYQATDRAGVVAVYPSWPYNN